MDEEAKRNNERVEDEEVILIKPYEVSSSTSISTYCYSTRVWTDFGLGLRLGP